MRVFTRIYSEAIFSRFLGTRDYNVVRLIQRNL